MLRTAAERSVICAPFGSELSAAYSLQFAHGTRRAFDTDSGSRHNCIGHHMISVDLCSNVVKALAALDPAGFGLDDACAQLEGSTYVMAESSLPFSVLIRAAGRRIVKISSVPSRTLSAVAPDAERCSCRPQGNVAASPKQLIDRAS